MKNIESSKSCIQNRRTIALSEDLLRSSYSGKIDADIHKPGLPVWPDSYSENSNSNFKIILRQKFRFY